MSGLQCWYLRICQHKRNTNGQKWCWNPRLNFSKPTWGKETVLRRLWNVKFLPTWTSSKESLRKIVSSSLFNFCFYLNVLSLWVNLLIPFHLCPFGSNLGLFERVHCPPVPGYVQGKRWYRKKLSNPVGLHSEVSADGTSNPASEGEKWFQDHGGFLVPTSIPNGVWSDIKSTAIGKRGNCQGPNHSLEQAGRA